VPLIRERIEYAVRVIQPIVYFDKVVCERLHADKERQREQSRGHAELQVMRLVSIDQRLALRDLRGLNKLLFHVVQLFFAQYGTVEEQVTETVCLIFLGFLL